jgi:hypothetical protein
VVDNFQFWLLFHLAATFSRMFCNILTDEGSLNILMHDCKKSLIVLTCSLGCIMLVWSSDGDISYYEASFLYCAVGAILSLWSSCWASYKDLLLLMPVKLLLGVRVILYPLVLRWFMLNCVISYFCSCSSDYVDVSSVIPFFG